MSGSIATVDLSALPLLHYDVIMADPPWEFRTRSDKGHGKAPQGHYPCMSLDDIKALPIASFAGRDCLLWLWATNPMLPQALEVMTAWGFTFKTAGHWVKRTKTGKLGFGTGYIFRSSGEPYLIGTFGSPEYRKDTRSVIEAEIREHSRKPEIAYQVAESMCLRAIRRLDLFTRERRAGWDAFGDEIHKFSGGVGNADVLDGDGDRAAQGIASPGLFSP